MVGDFEHVDSREAAAQQDGVDIVFGIAREQEPAILELAQQDDGGVIRLPVVGCGRIQCR